MNNRIYYSQKNNNQETKKIKLNSNLKWYIKKEISQQKDSLEKQIQIEGLQQRDHFNNIIQQTQREIQENRTELLKKIKRK